MLEGLFDLCLAGLFTKEGKEALMRMASDAIADEDVELVIKLTDRLSSDDVETIRLVIENLGLDALGSYFFVNAEMGDVLIEQVLKLTLESECLSSMADILNNLSLSRGQKESILERMSELASNLDEWKVVYENSSMGSDLERLAEQKMEECSG